MSAAIAADRWNSVTASANSRREKRIMPVRKSTVSSPFAPSRPRHSRASSSTRSSLCWEPCSDISKRMASPLRADANRQIILKALQVIREALPRQTIICTDMTQIAYVANEVFPVYEPHTWFHPVGFGTLGFGLPAGIGAKFGSPEKPVAVMVGDYGMQYTLNELGTAAEHKLPVIILLWNNESLGAIHDNMVTSWHPAQCRHPDKPGFPDAGKGLWLQRRKTLLAQGPCRAIKAALAADGPTLIEMTPAMVHG